MARNRVTSRGGRSRKVACDICGASLKPENLEGHIQRVHPEGEASREARQALTRRKQTARQASLARTTRVMVPALIVVVLLVSVYYFVAIYESPEDEATLPAWTLKDVKDDNTHRSSEYYPEGLTVVMFIHTDCYKCEDMAPILNDLYSEYENNLSGMFSIGGYPFGEGAVDDKRSISDFQNEYDCRWPHLYDDKGTLREAYGASDFFMLYMVKENKIVFEHAGKTTKSYLRQQIEEYL